MSALLFNLSKVLSWALMQKAVQLSDQRCPSMTRKAFQVTSVSTMMVTNLHCQPTKCIPTDISTLRNRLEFTADSTLSSEVRYIPLW